MRWIDIHCHLLPAMDDGPAKVSDALAMVHMARADGTVTMVATPHIYPGVYANTKIGIRQAYDKFCTLLQQENIPLQLRWGAEIRLTPSVLGELRRGNLPTYDEGGKYLLLEFPPDDIPPGSLYQVELICRAGYLPILAHQERNRAVRQDMEILSPFVALGCWLQLTASSLTGQYGSSIQTLCRNLLQRDWVRFIASDGHGFYHRQPVLSDGVRQAGVWIGQEEAEKMATVYPERMLAGERL